MDYTVGELAKRAGLTVRTLHHYEELGLLRPSGRSEAGYRRYGEADVLRLHRVLALRDAGLSLKEIAPLLDGEAPQPLAAVLQAQIEQIEAQIEAQETLLQTLRNAAKRLELHGDGGIIALTPDGQMAWSFNSPGMFRAKIAEGGTAQIGIYRDEP